MEQNNTYYDDKTGEVKNTPTLSQIEYDATCKGRVINAYTREAGLFNQNMEAGMTVQEALAIEGEKFGNELQIHPFKFLHFIYEYEVNGVTYTRASMYKCNRKDGLNAVEEAMRKEYIVHYRSDNPGQSKLGMSTKQKPKADGQAITGFICGLLGGVFSMIPILGFVLSLVGLIFAIKAIKGHTGKSVFAMIGLAFSIVGLLGTVISVFIMFVTILSMFLSILPSVCIMI